MRLKLPIVYFFAVAVPLLALAAILRWGAAWGDSGSSTAIARGAGSPPARLVFLQLAAILGATRCFGWAFGRIHQPRAIGEMVAGILLGPSLLGWIAPGISAALFPA